MENRNKIGWSIAFAATAKYEKLEINLTTQASKEIVKKSVERN